MINSKNLCMNCMNEMPIGNVYCPHCNYNNNTPQKTPFLKKETVIFNRYIVGKVHSFSADNITYIGYDTETESIVDIVEFYPESIASRPEASNDIAIKLGYETAFKDYLQSFLTLWNTLKDLNGIICLPQVIDIVDSNCTVYAVTKHKDCITLKAYFEDKKTPLTWKRTHFAFKGIVSALAKLHELGIVHGNISPESVFVGADGKIHLGKFSIKECFSGESEISSAPTDGFSPLEAYAAPPIINTYSDVYSLTALLYYCITGITPSKATLRAQKDDMVMPSTVAKTLTKSEIETFVKGLSLRAHNRIPTAEKLFNAFYTTATQASVAASQPKRKVPVKATTAKTKSTVNANTKEAKNNEQSLNSIIPLMVKTFATVIIVFVLLFTTLYGTFFYKNHNIEFLNKILSPISFLPINQTQEVVIDEEPSTIVTQSTSSYERAYVTVPDFTTQTLDSIKANETYNTNFTIILKYENSKEYAKNAVISQSLPVGESVLAGSEITILISEGAPQIELANVIGMDYDKASEKLKESGFKVKKELTENDGTQTENEVYLMSKVAGLEFDEGTEIVLYVWDEIPEEETTEETTTKKKETTTKKAETTTKKKETTTKKSETTTKKSNDE